MPLQDLLPADAVVTFRTAEAVRPAIRRACAARPELARCDVIGTSEQGRPIDGVVLGHGPLKVSLLAGNHADEPVGPETLRHLVVHALDQPERVADLLARFTFVIVPHTNPDGEALNQSWMARWPDLEAYLDDVQRELPGRDLEFGFPDLRSENRAVSAFLASHAPFALHASLHGMALSEGALLLLERHWSFRCAPLRDAFCRAAEAAGLGLHDHNRWGEKGFFYLGPGFNTTPEGEAMRTFFRAQDDEAMAARFRDSSMEFVRGLGGDPLCLVTELPLWVLPRDPAAPPGEPRHYARWRAYRAARNQPGAPPPPTPVPQPVDPTAAVRIHLATLDAALDLVAPRG